MKALLFGLTLRQLIFLLQELICTPPLYETRNGLYLKNFFSIKSKSYKTMLKSNLNERTLIDSEIDILVVALYTHPILSLLAAVPEKR